MWLTQANTSIKQVLYFYLYIYVLFSLNKCKSLLVVSSMALAGWRLGNVLGQPECFHTTLSPQTGLFTDTLRVYFTLCIFVYYIMYIYIYILILNSVFDFLILQARKFIILFCLSHWVFLYHSPHSLFPVRCVFALLPISLLHTVTDSSELVNIVGCYYIVYPLDKFCKTFMFITFSLISCVDTIFCSSLVSYFESMVRVLLSIFSPSFVHIYTIQYLCLGLLIILVYNVVLYYIFCVVTSYIFMLY